MLFRAAMLSLKQTYPDADVQIEFGENMGQMLGYEEVEDTGWTASAKWSKQIPYTTLTISANKGDYYNGYPAECMRTGKPYVAVRLNKGSGQVFDFHFQVFEEQDGSWCLGCYQSVANYSALPQGCWVYSCGPSLDTREQIKDAVYTGVAAVGAGAAASWAAAQMVAPYAVFAL